MELVFETWVTEEGKMDLSIVASSDKKGFGGWHEAGLRPFTTVSGVEGAVAVLMQSYNEHIFLMIKLKDPL